MVAILRSRTLIQPNYFAGLENLGIGHPNRALLIKINGYIVDRIVRILRIGEKTYTYGSCR